MRIITRTAALACLALAVAVPAGAETYEREQTDVYTGASLVRASGQYVAPMSENGWLDYIVYPDEHTVTIAITDQTGRPVAGVVTQLPLFSTTFQLFCGTITVPVVWTDQDTQTVYANPLLGEGPEGCETSVPVRGQVTATITGTLPG